MFSYCGNNPVNRSDPSGHFWILAIAAIGIVATLLTGCNQTTSLSSSSSVSPSPSGLTYGEIVDNANFEASVSSSTPTKSDPVIGYKRSNDFPKYPVSGKTHTGTDFPAPTGTPIHSVYSGKVVDVSGNESEWFGNYVVIESILSETTYRMYYAHMSKTGESITVGWDVNSGDVIGYVGNTGNSDGPHLHFEVRADPYRFYPRASDYLDPRLFLN